MTTAIPSGERALPRKWLDAQKFQGFTQIPDSDLAAATGLNRGDELTPNLVNAARLAILDLCAKSNSGSPSSLKCRMQTTIEGKVTLTWIIAETD
ncbi:MAG TPA: hypothetical protein VGK90_08140 [Rhizomicrobium sp.]|jgi:hypothetical protein